MIKLSLINLFNSINLEQSTEEYKLLWGLPQFSNADQKLFFSLTTREQLVFDRLRTPRTQLHFRLFLGYFLDKVLFFLLLLTLKFFHLRYSKMCSGYRFRLYLMVLLYL